MIRNKVILIAEDDADDRLLIKEAFEENQTSATIIFFENGEELLNYLKDFSKGEAAILPDLFILDLNMPKTNGKEVLKYLKEQNIFKEIPVIILTTSKLREEEKNVLTMGAAGFYTKPSSFTELVDLTASVYRTWIV
ncbi:response regulator [Desertivirga xinjiangensis]|uniref:response regulator n=1 Tax=Desertivirga xinjiangensis TaxID=539206 RepID=UPI002108DEE0|nr:response regulator [Pedobacter xinjiangensis]